MKIISNNEMNEEPLVEIKKIEETVKLGKLKCIIKHNEQPETVKE